MSVRDVRARYLWRPKEEAICRATLTVCRCEQGEHINAGCHRCNPEAWAGNCRHSQESDLEDTIFKSKQRGWRVDSVVNSSPGLFPACSCLELRSQEILHLLVSGLTFTQMYICCPKHVIKIKLGGDGAHL